MASYTSNTEFALVKRVQITNEVPPVSLWHLLPSGLQNDFWKYVIGTVEVEHNVDVIGPDAHPEKIVNGTPAPKYGPPVPATPNYESPEQFHNLILDGVITPEFDYMLHELYRYLDTIYPDHPDYDQLLTPLEANEMFRAAAAIIGYVPNYTFLENWTRSVDSKPMPQEEMKWKIRDLRSLAFRRKFFGSYQGYKMLFSSIQRHGSVYITGMYHPLYQGRLDPNDARTNRRFRLLDYFGVNDSVYKENANITFKGIISPNATVEVYHYDYYSSLSLDVAPLTKAALGAFLYREESRDTTGITIQTIESEIIQGSQLLYFLRLSAPQSPTTRTYEIRREDTPDVVEFTSTLTPSPRNLGIFDLPLVEARYLYPSEPIIVGDIAAAELLHDRFIPGNTLIRDEYIVEIFTYEDRAALSKIIRGELLFSLEPERSPVMITPPIITDPRYGVEVSIRRYEESFDGSVISHTDAVFIQTTLQFTIDSTGRPTFAKGNIVSLPDINPLSGEANRSLLLNETDEATISVGATVRFVHYDEERGVWDYMYGYEGWIDSYSWGALETTERVHRGTEVSAGQSFSAENFAHWKERAAVPFTSETASSDEIAIYGEVHNSAPNRILISNSVEARKLEYISSGDQVRGPGVPSNTVITVITSDYFEVSTDILRFGLSEFFVRLRSTRSVEEIDLSDFKMSLHTLYPAMTSSIFAAMWPSERWPHISRSYLEGLKDASLFQPLAVERVTDNPARIAFDNAVFLELSLDRILRHHNSASFKMGASYASLMDISWLEYLDSFLSIAKRATEDVRIGVQLSLTTDRSGLYSIIPGDKYTDTDINARFITIPYNYSQDDTPAYVQLGTGGHTAERERLFTSVSDLLRPPLYGTVFYDSNRDTSEDPEAISVQRRGVYASSARQLRIMGNDTDDNIASNDHLDSPLFEVPLGEHEYAKDIAPFDLPSNRHQIIQTSFYLEEFSNVELTSELVVNSPYITKGEQLPRDLYRFRGRWNPTPSEDDRNEPIWPSAPSDNPFQDRDYFFVSTTATVGSYEYVEGDWLLYINGEWVRRQWLILGEWPPGNEPSQDIYLSPSKVQLQEHLSPLGLSIRDALDKYFIYFIASRDLNLLDKIEEGSNTASVIEVKRHDWIILTRETYVDDVVNNLQVRMVQDGDDYLLISPPDGGREIGEWIPEATPDNPNQPLWPDASDLHDLDYYVISESATIGDYEFRKHDYIRVRIEEEVPETDTEPGVPRTETWGIETYSYISWTEYQPWLVAGGMTYEIIRQSFDRSILGASSFNTITNQRAELIDSTLQTLDLPRRFISRGSCNFQLKIDPQFYATDVDGVRFSLTESPVYWDQSANRFFVNNTSSNGNVSRHYIKFQEPTYFKNLLSIVGTVFAETPNEVHIYPGHEFDADLLSLTDRVESGNYVYIRNPYEDSIENQYYSHYVSAYGIIDFEDDTKLSPSVDTPLAAEREEEFRLALLGIAPKQLADGQEESSVVRSVTPVILRTYEERFENKYYRNLLMLGGIIKRDTPNVIWPVDQSAEAMQTFANAMNELNAGDYIQSVYLTTGTTYSFAPEILTESNQALRDIVYGGGVWIAVGTNGAFVRSEDETAQSGWTAMTLPPEWNSANSINTALFSNDTNTWWIFGSHGNIATSLNFGQTWDMYAEPESWEISTPNISVAAQSNAIETEGANSPKILVIGTDDGQLAYFDETLVTPIWTPSPLPQEGVEVTDGGVDDDNSENIDPETGEPAEEFDVNDPDVTEDPSIVPPSASAWGDTAVLSIGYNSETDTWMVGGAGGKLAITSSLTDPTLTEDDPDSGLPTSQWSYRTLPDDLLEGNVTAITNIGGIWVVGGDHNEQGFLLYSEDDGVTWSSCELIDESGNPESFLPILKLTWKPGEWLASSHNGTVYTSAIPTELSSTGEHELAKWISKDIPNLPTMSITALAAVGDIVVMGGDSTNVYTISNTTKPSVGISIYRVNQDESVFNIETDGPIIDENDWGTEMEITALLSIYTLRSIEDSYVGILPSQLATFTNPKTRQLYISSFMSVDSPDIANRVYLPRTDEILLEPTLASGEANPEYIGANGYPLYSEKPEFYSLRADGTPQLWTNEDSLPIHYCDASGNYIDERGLTLSTSQFIEEIVVTSDDEEEEETTRVDYADPRETAWQPLYASYLDWLADNNDIEESDTPLDLGVGNIEISEIWNEQNETPWLRITASITEAVLSPPYNGVHLSILPAEPVPIPLVGFPRYRTDQSGTNLGIVAEVTGDQVSYTIEPLSNNISLLATKGPNTGLVASSEDGTDEKALYSLEPVQSLPTAFATEEGSVIAITRDNVAYYTIDDAEITGLYFHPKGYGSWADRPNTDTRFPWENDPNAFVGFDLDEDGLNDEFVYLQNLRQDPVYLVDEMGKRVLDENGDPILVPAPKHLTYFDLLANSGDFAEKEQIKLNVEPTITGVAQDSKSFELSNPIPLEEGAHMRQVRLNLLTLASIETTERTKYDTRLIHELSIQDMAKYEPDRVYYLESAYPSRLAKPELYEAGLFTNRNGAAVYACNALGQYVSDLENADSVTNILADRARPPRPRFYLCQDWFNNDYFVQGSEDNPYWQYLIFEDYLDHRSKEWKQRVGTYQKVKGELGREMVMKRVPDEEAYVDIYPGLEYVQDASSMIVRQTDYIQYRLGRINCIMVANPRYDRTVNPEIDSDNARYGINYQSVFHEAVDQYGDPVNMFNNDAVVQTRLKGKWSLNYTLNTTKNFANPQDTRSSIVAITELGVYNRDSQMIAYATFPPVIYDSVRHHMSVNLLIKQGEFALLND